MRKALKRQLGREKQAENLQKSKEAGLRAQEVDNVRRQRELQEALIRRDKKSKKVEAGTSKKALEKKQRVEERAAELERLNKKIDGQDAQNLKRVYEPSMMTAGPGEDLDRLTKDSEDEQMAMYAKADVDLTMNLLDVLFPPKQVCKTYHCTYSTKEEHEKICPGNVSFRPVDVDLQSAVTGKAETL